jgi:glutathione S-transferase
MADIQIYGVPPSTFTRAVRIACHEKGIDYELVPTMPSQAGELNPLRKIPVMVHGDFTLFESAAILRYLDRTFGGRKLWPDEAQAAARVDQWVAAVGDSVLNSAQRYMASRYNFLPVPIEMRQIYLDKTREVLPVFDRQLAKTRFLAGDEFTAADCLFAPPYFYLDEIPELKAIADAAPHCRRWAREMAARPSVIATEPPVKPQLAA